MPSFVATLQLNARSIPLIPFRFIRVQDLGLKQVVMIGRYAMREAKVIFRRAAFQITSYFMVQTYK
jgi:hypothetical protein